MIRFLLRAFSLVVLAAAFASAVIDGTRSIAAQSVALTSVADGLAKLTPTKAPLLQPWALAHLPHWASDPALETFLRLPVWLPLAVLGLILLRLSRPPQRPIGYSNRD